MSTPFVEEDFTFTNPDGSTVRVDHGAGDGAEGAHEADGLTLTVV